MNYFYENARAKLLVLTHNRLPGWYLFEMARVVGMCTVLAMLLGVPCTANDQQDHYQEGIAHYMDGKIRLAQLSFSEAALAQPGPM